MKYLEDLDLAGKKILYRVDINSNIVNGAIADDTRIRAILPSLEMMLEKGTKQVVILAHQGRPDKSQKTNHNVQGGGEFRLDLHAKRLSELMGQEVVKMDSCRDVEIPAEAKLVMLENVRLDDETEKDEGKREAFAKVLAEYGGVYVNDAFAACHREHATISELPKLMPVKAAGLLLQKEIEALKPLLEGDVEHPFTIIVAGAKIDTKIGVIQQFLDSADHFLVGGGIANTFLFAEGFDVADSLYEEDKMEIAQEIAMQLDGKEDGLVIPTDVICADEIGENVATVDIPVEDVMGDMKILDIGKQSAERFAKIISNSKTVIWNGPVGLTEFSPFQGGSKTIAEALVAADATTIVGGGESVGVINTLGISHDEFSHVSTGGGAMLEYLSGKELPGLAALEGAE
jgi:phosphoglycerate kinase